MNFMGKIKTFMRLLLFDHKTLNETLMRYFANMKISHIIPDKKFISMRYHCVFGEKLNFENPKTFNEKLNWLKLYNRNPQYPQMVDKYNVKNYVSHIIGSKYIVKTIGIWDDFDSIDFDKLPDKFVLKCTHDSGSVVICRDKNTWDKKSAKAKLEKGLKRNLFYWGREWPYKIVKPRIMAEEFMKDNSNENLPVYKFMCFNGKPKIIQTIQDDKQPNESIDYFDTQWNLLDIRQNYPNSKTPFLRPEKLEEMLELAEKLSRGHSFIRVDLYVVNNEIKFSEYTFYSDCGLARFEPQEWDEKLGDMIDLGPLKHNMR